MACEKCGGNCADCAGCGASLELTPGELEFLRLLGQYSFLPVARKAEDLTPVCLEWENENSSLILQCLEKKGLVDLSYRKALAGADMSKYAGYPVRGSVGLTQRGLAVLELLEFQGITE